MADIIKYYVKIGQAVELPIGARFVRAYFQENHHQRDELIARNGKLGSCSGCPMDAVGNKFPEFCVYKDRYDHNIMETGQVFEYTMEDVPNLG